jgi:hypothetical protein
MATVRPQSQLPVPVWQRDRQQRRQYKRNAKAWGIRVPKLRTVVLVETTAIPIPAWALKKAIPGLKPPAGGVWLGRIAGKLLADMDRQSGGRPKVTQTFYRPCRICGRGLIGVEAELRWEQDREWEASKTVEERWDPDSNHRGIQNPTPCGPDCVERHQAVRKK